MAKDAFFDRMLLVLTLCDYHNLRGPTCLAKTCLRLDVVTSIHNANTPMICLHVWKM